MATVSGSARMTLEELSADLEAEMNSLDTEDAAQALPDSGAVGGAIETESNRSSAPETLSEDQRQQAQDWQAQIDGLDRKELLRNNRVAGIVGDEAKRLADSMTQAAREEIRKQLETERAEAEKKELLERDPYEYRERVRTEAEQAQAASERQRIHDEAWHKATQDLDKDVLYSLFNEQPENVQTNLSGKHYEGSDKEARQNYVRDLINTRVAHELVTARKRWEQDALPALRKQVAESELSENSPIATRSTSQPRHFDTPEDLDKMSLADFDALGLDKIMAELGI